GGGLEALGGLNSRMPQARWGSALGFDDPVAMGEISGAVDGELGLLAPEQLVGAGGETEQDPGGGDDGGTCAHGCSERLGELAVGPAPGLAVVGLDEDAARHFGSGDGEEQPREVVGVDYRDPAPG